LADKISVDVHIGRQAILDRQRNIVGYELLFRSGSGQTSSDRSDFSATATVLSGALLDLGLDRLADGCRVLVNVPGDHLGHPALSLLPPDRIVLEILETTVVTPEVHEACQSLRKRGFLLVLDDYIGQPELEPLIDYVVCVKLDFRGTDLDTLRMLANRLRGRGKKLLAEKLETAADYENALQAGCDYFQGYYFERPVIVAGRRVSVRQLNLIQILSALSTREDLSLTEAEKIVSQDVGLTVKLLRFANTAIHGGAVDSLGQCFMRLGVLEIRRFVAILLLPQLSSTSNPTMIEKAVIRGRMCENLAQATGRGNLGPTAFLTGMLSMLDAIMGVPLTQILKELHVSEDMYQALVATDRTRSPLAIMLKLTRLYEDGRVSECSTYAAQNRMRLKQVSECYLEAIRWASTNTLQGSAATPVHAWSGGQNKEVTTGSFAVRR
jgi:EAL and modified HD-GYP domain-containing signal transduction protein